MSNANEPAFPVSVPAGQFKVGSQGDGLTKREYFAAMAMQGYLSRLGDDIGNIQNRTMSIYKASVMVADALLLELAKEKTE